MQFNERLHPAGITYDPEMFNNWKLVFTTRLVLTALNASIIILALKLLPKLMINLYWRFKKQPPIGRDREEVTAGMELFKSRKRKEEEEENEEEEEGGAGIRERK